MVKEIAEKYEHIKFQEEILDYYIELLRQEKPSKDKDKKVNGFDMFDLIFRHSPLQGNPNKTAKGITLAEIMRLMNITTYVARELLQLLIGTTLIYSRHELGPGNLWVASSRSIQLQEYIVVNNIQM